MRTNFKCNVCQGDDLVFDALAVWDKVTQKYSVQEVADPVAYCATCQTDTEDWGEYPIYRDIQDLQEDEKILTRLDKSIIEVMDIIRDETGMDSDSDDDDYLWGIVYGYVHSALAEAYDTRLNLLRERAEKAVDNKAEE